jgi:hypothetical protein
MIEDGVRSDSVARVISHVPLRKAPPFGGAFLSGRGVERRTTLPHQNSTTIISNLSVTRLSEYDAFLADCVEFFNRRCRTGVMCGRLRRMQPLLLGTTVHL